jgi:hypothetical protein
MIRCIRQTFTRGSLCRIEPAHRLCRDRPPLCIGTSATMSSQEDDTERAVAVAKVASRLFGTDIPPMR